MAGRKVLNLEIVVRHHLEQLRYTQAKMRESGVESAYSVPSVSIHSLVAQWFRAMPYEGRGWEFESLQGNNIIQLYKFT